MRDSIGTFVLVLLAAGLCLLPGAQAAETNTPSPMGIYISSGDNDWLSKSPPVQSEASISAVFDAVKHLCGVQRIYWRGLQSRVVVDHHVIRRENPVSAGFWEWQRHLIRDVDTTAIARKAAAQRGMEFWAFTALFDHGAAAEDDSAKGYGPSPCEDELRVRHPEWIPVDRHGVRRQGGPIELAYPAARRALVDRFLRLAAADGYDGIAFFTYVEHFSQRFDEEFGYSEPIVAEFKRRHGKDIRTEEFDRAAWGRLRGEYVTLFLQELKAGLARQGKKLAVCLDPQEMDLPAPWLIVRDVRPAGRIFLDWERWAREGIVDDVIIYYNGDKTAAIRRALAAVRGTPCRVITAWGTTPFPPDQEEFARAGVMRVMYGAAEEIEAGTPEPQPPAALDSRDAYAILSVLRQVVKGTIRVEPARVTPHLQHPNVLVRRQTVAALGALGGLDAVRAVESALADPENGVRCVAAAVLAKVNGPESVAAICRALRRTPTFQLEQDAANAFAAMGDERLPDLLRAAKDPDPLVRRPVVHGLARGRLRADLLPALLAALGDGDWRVRWSAALGLGQYGPWPQAPERLLEALAEERDVAVQARIVSSLESSLRTRARVLIGPTRRRVLAALSARFAGYGGRGRREDADWGWRPTGNALLALGEPGREALEAFLGQREDRRLAELAWQVLHVRQTGWTYCKATEEQAEEAFRHHPRVAPPKKAPAAKTTPEWLPYLEQSFDGLNPDDKGQAGDNLCERGLWRTFKSDGPQIQDAVARAGRAVRLARTDAGGSPLEGMRSDLRLTDQETRIDLAVYRETPSTAFALNWKDSGSGRVPVGLFVDTGGMARVWSRNEWVRTETRIPSERWVRFRIEVQPGRGSYTVRTGDDLATVVAADLPLPGGESFNLLSIHPQPPSGGVLYVDDISVSVRPAPANHR